MKKIGSLQMILGLLAALSFFSLILVLQPALIPILNLSTDEASNIGSAIGGITAPIVGMFSAYLLYEALTAQLKNNKDQRGKGDTDIFFLMLNQLDKNYDAFVFEKTHPSRKMETYTGYEGLSQFALIFKTSNDVNKYQAFKVARETPKIIYLVRSFQLIRKRTNSSEFDGENRDMCSNQLDIYYRTKFKFPIRYLVDAFGSLSEPLAVEIAEFQRLNDVLDY